MKKLNVPLTVLEHTKQCNNDFSCLANEEYKGFGDCEAAYLTKGDNILFLKSTEPYNVCSFRDTHSNNRQACSCPTRFYSFSKRKNTKAILKQCGLCLETWKSSDDFLGDPDITLVGYQVAFQALETGLFLFNHSCRSTISINANAFTHLYDGPVFQERATGSDDCPGYCLDHSELRPCTAKCECAYVREVLQIVKNWPK